VADGHAPWTTGHEEEAGRVDEGEVDEEDGAGMVRPREEEKEGDEEKDMGGFERALDVGDDVDE